MVRIVNSAGIVMGMHLMAGILLQVFAALFGLIASRELMGGMVGFFAGGLITRALFRNLIPTKCPNPACGALSAYQRGSQPITYVCETCGYEHATSISEGGSDNFHF